MEDRMKRYVEKMEVGKILFTVTNELGKQLVPFKSPAITEDLIEGRCNNKWSCHINALKKDYIFYFQGRYLLYSREL